MKDWKYISGAEVGNAIYSELNKDNKRVVIEEDGSWYVYDKNGKIVEQGRESNSDNAFGKFKAKGYNKKACNQDGVARMFEGLVKDENKDEKKDSGAIDDLEKVGNETYQHKLYPDKYVIIEGKNYKIVTDGKVEKTGELTDAVLYGINQTYKKVGNSKVWNAIGGGVQSEAVLTEAKDGSQYWVEKTSKSGQYAQYNLYYTIGQGKRHAGVFKDKEAAIAAGRRIIGNSSSNEEYWKKQYIEAARKKGIPENKIQEFIKKIEKEGAKGVLSPIKNSNSEDEKFAYVMREFEEGKLKSSSGETVTDPAQAKAIAYSESKKAENGLARARKAIH